MLQQFLGLRLQISPGISDYGVASKTASLILYCHLRGWKIQAQEGLAESKQAKSSMNPRIIKDWKYFEYYTINLYTTNTSLKIVLYTSITVACLAMIHLSSIFEFNVDLYLFFLSFFPVFRISTILCYSFRFLQRALTFRDIFLSKPNALPTMN